MSEEIRSDGLTEEEQKKIRHKRRLIKKRRMEKKQARKELRLRAILEEEENAPQEDPQQRRERLYAKAQKKLRFAPHMYRKEDRADMYRQAAELFGETEGYEDADALCEQCLWQAEENRRLYIEETFALATEQLSRAKTLIDCQKIRGKLDAIADYKDVSELRAGCEQLERQLQKKQNLKKFLKKAVIGVVILALLIVIIYVQGFVRVDAGL